MKNLKYVIAVLATIVVVIIAALVAVSPRRGRRVARDAGVVSRVEGIVANALTQPAPRADYSSEEYWPDPPTAAADGGLVSKPGMPKKTKAAAPMPVASCTSRPRAGIEDSDVRVTLQLDPLKMGGIYARTYKADFIGDYVVKNLEEKRSKLTLYFPFPPNAGTMYEVMLLVNGEEPKDVNYSGQGIAYSDSFAPREERPVRITYKAYGTGSYNYGLEHNRRVRKLHVVVEVKGSELVRLGSTTLMPTDRKLSSGLTTYTWDLANLITSADIGIELVKR